ncbi:YihY/virulence factor BrkB family protein [Gordonia sp. ABSL1-1]|uniref:YihY/virulence factor BrkB family protein n=1 Tax=Gordonia sp. ABSL1-1 TaxID=3053923 RepID=UPI0025726155|nr:YihY/virulence factor BrkB family protein [Gordonia sp. ABSL1-1]MDL9936382.1 YihY/virulence factor BrkB family protein [Gordonia sp. ABSL1-1]
MTTAPGTASGRADRPAQPDPPGHDDPLDTPDVPPTLPVLPNLHRLVWRTIVNAWNHGIVGWAAQAAFWQVLSLPPLLLGLLGSVGYVAGWFGPDTVDVIYDRIIAFANRTFSDSVVTDLITPTVDNVLNRGRVGLVSLGFVLSLWAGSSAVSCFIASIVRAHEQHEIRNPVWQRIFALLLYIVFLFVAVLLLPLVALGPKYLHEIVPDSWDPIITTLIDFGYFPFVTLLMLLVLTTLYHLALPNPLPWHRLVGGAVLAGVVFWIAGYVLRIYLTAVTRADYSYGALATPIAFLLFAFFLGFAIVLGAEFNAAVQTMWPAKASTTTQVREWVNSQTSDLTGQIRGLPDRLSSGPIRRTRQNQPDDDRTGGDRTGGDRTGGDRTGGDRTGGDRTGGE